MDALEAVGNPELRATLLWARAQTGPVTADDLAAAHGLHRNVARGRLERLTAAGLLRPSYERRTGRQGPGAGRPAKLYAVSPQLEAIGFPSHRYDPLVGRLVEGARPERLREIGAAFGAQLAGPANLRPAKTLRGAVDRMCAALGRLGYHVTTAEVDEERALLVTPTCPLRPLVLSTPAAGELDRGMWSGLAEAALAGASLKATCSECHDGDVSCRVSLARF